jgi:hypothetical protein
MKFIAGNWMRLGLLFAWWAIFPVGCLGMIMSFRIVGHLSGPTSWALAAPVRCLMSVGLLALVLVVTVVYLTVRIRDSTSSSAGQPPGSA